jgi:ABC-type multidrug transport system ATPase subunit
MEIVLSGCTIKIKNQIILQDINFKLEEGKFHHLFGQNGAGKSVFLQGMLGLIPFYEGQYTIRYEKDDLCYITSIPFYFDNERVSRVVKLLATLYSVDVTDLQSIMSGLQLKYEQIKTKKMHELSQGMRQKIAILPLFLQGLSFFVLDEISVGFDKQTQQKVCNRLYELARAKQTVLLVEHNAEMMDVLKETIEMEGLLCDNQRLLHV